MVAIVADRLPNVETLCSVTERGSLRVVGKEREPVLGDILSGRGRRIIHLVPTHTDTPDFER